LRIDYFVKIEKSLQWSEGWDSFHAKRPGLLKCEGVRGILADFQECGFVLGGGVLEPFSVYQPQVCGCASLIYHFY